MSIGIKTETFVEPSERSGLVNTRRELETGHCGEHRNPIFIVTGLVVHGHLTNKTASLKSVLKKVVDLPSRRE